jgi:hypothetical protein
MRDFLMLRIFEISLRTWVASLLDFLKIDFFIVISTFLYDVPVDEVEVEL